MPDDSPIDTSTHDILQDIVEEIKVNGWDRLKLSMKVVDGKHLYGPWDCWERMAMLTEKQLKDIGGERVFKALDAVGCTPKQGTPYYEIEDWVEAIITLRAHAYQAGYWDGEDRKHGIARLLDIQPGWELYVNGDTL